MKSFLKNKHQPRVRLELIFVAGGALVSYFFAMVILWGSGAIQWSLINTPISSSGDAKFTIAYVQRLSEGWYWNTHRLGYPFGSKDGDFPVLDLASSFVLKILVELTNSAVAAVNIYFLIGFPLVYVATYYVSRRYGLSAILSFATGLTYAFLPFHFQRFDHLFYTWYFVVPLFFLVAKILHEDRIFGKDELFFEKTKFLVLALLISLFGVYYSAFGLILIAVTMCIQVSTKSSRRSLLFGIYSLGCVALGLFLSATPSFIFKLQFGNNQNVVSRNQAESEVYGFKLVQLLLPRTGHRLNALSDINAAYSTTSPLVNENMMSSLGLIGATGFIAMIFIQLVNFRNLRNYQAFRILAPITTVLFFFGTIGGLGSLFSLIVTPNIRAWNRISIFIAFASILALYLLVQRFFDECRRALIKKSKIVFVVFLLVISFMDQVNGICLACNSENAQSFQDDAKFFKQLEDKLPRSAAIFQLPFMSYPEVPNLNSLDSYGHLDAFIHTSNLRWSFGMVKGRISDDFYRMISGLKIVEQLPILERLGFGAIYVDRDGYADNGVAIVEELSSILGKPIIQNIKGDRLVYRINDSLFSPLDDLSEKQILEKARISLVNGEIRYPSKIDDGIDFRREGLPSFVFSISGLSGVEEWGRWSDRNLGSSVEVTFSEALPESFSMILEGIAFGPNIGSELTIVCGSVSKKIVIYEDSFTINEKFELRSNQVNVMRIIPSKPISPYDLGIGADTRAIGVGLISLTIIQE